MNFLCKLEAALGEKILTEDNSRCMAASTTVVNPVNNKPWGLGGLFGNSQVTLTCPTGSYISHITAKSGSNVNSIQSIVCKDVVTGAQTASIGPPFGGGGGDTQAVDCSAGAGVAGFQINTRNASNQGSDINGLRGFCRSVTDTSNNTSAATGNCMGAGNCPSTSSTVNACPSGQVAYQLSGGTTTDNQTVGNFSFSCKKLSGSAAMAQNSLARGKCIVGDDTSTDCAEIKNLLSAQGASAADVKGYCSQGDNIINSSKCVSWYNGGQNDGTNYQQIMVGPDGLSGWCTQGSNVNSAQCSQYCTADSGAATTQKAACDTVYTNSCSQPANQDFAICSSLQPWSSFPGIDAIEKIPGAPLDPLCYFSEPRASGYKKVPLNIQNCPQCVQNQTISITNSTASAVSNIQQICPVSSPTTTSATTPATTPATMPATTPATPPSSSSSSTSPTSKTPTTASSSNTMYYIIGGAVLLMIVIVMIVIMI